MFNENRYRYHQFEKNGQLHTVAISTYAGKTVRGVAKCAPEDEADPEYGKKLAAARCNSKVTEKRYKRAMDKVNDAIGDLNKAFMHLERMKKYLAEAQQEYNEAITYQASIENR